jgi:hypothetical protein
MHMHVLVLHRYFVPVRSDGIKVGAYAPRSSRRPKWWECGPAFNLFPFSHNISIVFGLSSADKHRRDDKADHGDHLRGHYAAGTDTGRS